MPTTILLIASLLRHAPRQTTHVGGSSVACLSVFSLAGAAGRSRRPSALILRLLAIRFLRLAERRAIIDGLSNRVQFIVVRLDERRAFERIASFVPASQLRPYFRLRAPHRRVGRTRGASCREPFERPPPRAF